MTKWLYLKPGDVVDIIATTPGLKTENLKNDLEFLCQKIKDLGLIPRVDLQALLDGSAFFSNFALATRARELRKAIYAKDSKAIWVIRGGYGTSQLLNILDRDTPPEITKLIIGYSDVNCLHLWVNKHWNWPSLHFKVLYEFLENIDEKEITAFRKIVFNLKEELRYDNLIALNSAAKSLNLIEAVVTGGTIQVLQSGIGLNWQFDPNEKIVLFEEIFDRGVRLYRTLNQFMQLKLLQNAKAIIFGDIICGKEADGSEACDYATEYFAKNTNIPVFKISDIGHGKINLPIPLNKKIKISFQTENKFNLILSS